MACKLVPIVSPLRPYLVLFFGGAFAPLGFVMVIGRAFAALVVPLVIPALVLAMFGVAVGAFSWGFGRLRALAPYRPHFAAKHEVVLGRDGIRLSALHDRRFVPYRAIERVEMRADAVIVLLRDGGEVALHVWTGAIDDDVMRRELAAELTREAAAAATRGEEHDEVAAHLARNGREVAEWVRFARGLGGRNDGYRATAARRADLWRVVEDGGADDDARVAAALALRVDADVADRERLVTIAADSASPRVRISVEAGEAGEDDLAEALVASFLRGLPRRERHPESRV